MRFDNVERKLTQRDMVAIESSLGFGLPTALRAHYLRWNGGSPDPYVFEDASLDTVVAECLPLTSSGKRGTAIDAYRVLVLARAIVPPNFFPFAVDGGGDYFFIDCASAQGLVYFYRGDSSREHDRLVPLHLGIDEFWSSLVPE